MELYLYLDKIVEGLWLVDECKHRGRRLLGQPLRIGSPVSRKSQFD